MTRRATMVKVFGKSKRLFDKLALGNALARCEEPYAARIGFEY
jgi:hypothetical protein